MAEAVLTVAVVGLAAAALLALVAWVRRRPSPDRPRKTRPGGADHTGVRDRPGGPGQEPTRDPELHPGEREASGP